MFCCALIMWSDTMTVHQPNLVQIKIWLVYIGYGRIHVVTKNVWNWRVKWKGKLHTHTRMMTDHIVLLSWLLFLWNMWICALHGHVDMQIFAMLECVLFFLTSTIYRLLYLYLHNRTFLRITTYSGTGIPQTMLFGYTNYMLIWIPIKMEC